MTSEPTLFCRARLKISTHSEAQHLQDVAAERCSMPYRPPELFQVNSKCEIDERTDVWVSELQGGPSASGKKYVDTKVEVLLSCRFIL